MLKVTKFGGSSMADAAHYRQVREILQADPARRVAVVSAAGRRFGGDHKITDLLYLCHAHLTYGVKCDGVFEKIRSRYLEIRDELQVELDLETEFSALRERMRDGISRDELASRGEYFSARLLAAYLGFVFVDAAEWLYFRMDGSVDKERSYEALRKVAEGKRVVIPGFYGIMPDGGVRTLTRGGSDITGALAAAALDAAVYENWTDVSGILMADPRIVKDTRSVRRITYAELRELSFNGAEVLHEAAVFPVREKNIPLNIRNTNMPGHPGTLIGEQFGEEDAAEGFITGIAGKRNFTCITLVKSGMSSDPSALRRVLEVLEAHGVPLAYAPTGIDCFSAVVESKALEPVRYALLAELERLLTPDEIRVADGLAVIAVVGRHMAARTGTSGRIFAALGAEGVNIRFISQGPQEMNIIVGVENGDFERTVRLLYDNFVC